MDRRANWGCIVGGIIAVPLGVIWLTLSALGGFGCEGAEDPCSPRYGTFLLGVGIIVGSAFAVAAIINAIASRMRR
jgi:hypothetical protein